MKKVILTISFVIIFGISCFGQTDADKEAIKATAMDYMESWYEGNAERMEKALHPDLAKRIFTKDEKGRTIFQHMGAMKLVQNVRQGMGKSTPKEKQIKEVVILDIFENIATVKTDMGAWVDYMHLAKVEGKWIIVNVLWEFRPKKKE